MAHAAASVGTGWHRSWQRLRPQLHSNNWRLLVDHEQPTRCPVPPRATFEPQWPRIVVLIM
eukprot:7023642-Lingulodinium_polyedra.AAC.1